MREPPRTIGRYEVERMLGQGGMGVVWLCRDTVLNRRVAIKVLRDDLALAPQVKDELVERMRHEARAAAAVSHPNIVTLHDMGEDDKVGLFLVFEYVAGPNGDAPESLRERLRGGSLPLPEIATLARQLGSALTFAHEAGVIHRDIKPENVLFSRTGAKIADFGIARIPESTITRTNTVLGTPAYTSPEALSFGTFGPKSDQFSLAATLYEAACGVRAFAAEDPITTAGKVSSEPPPPLEGGPLGSSARVRALDEMLGRGLAKAPEDRFSSCAELGDSVARAIERAPADETPSGRLAIDPKLIEMERTPLSSRMALVEKHTRMKSDRPPPVIMTNVDTPVRHSIMVRQKTQKLQNVVAGVALLVIVVLVLMGGHRTAEDAARDAADAAASAQAQRAQPKRAAKPIADASAE
jgi:serine/threonine protein kinase